MTRLTVDLLELSLMIDRSESWTHKNWRTIVGLPPPFIGAGKSQHPRWRRAQIDAFMAGQNFPAAPAAPDTVPENPETVAKAEKDNLVRSLLAGL